MNFVMGVTVGLEFSGISVDELRHECIEIPEISIRTATHMAKSIFRYTLDLPPESNTHDEVHL
jgi:hypothetical protein